MYEEYNTIFDEDEEQDDPEDGSEDESEDEPEEETAVAVSKPFNSDKCVVCLTNKPDILFMDCLH